MNRTKLQKAVIIPLPSGKLDGITLQMVRDVYTQIVFALTVHSGINSTMYDYDKEATCMHDYKLISQHIKDYV